MDTPFSERTRRRIEELGLSQREAARRAGLPERRFGHYIKRRPDTGVPSEPDFADLLKICNALDTHPNFLLGVTDEPRLTVGNHHKLEWKQLKRLVRVTARMAKRL